MQTPDSYPVTITATYQPTSRSRTEEFAFNGVASNLLIEYCYREKKPLSRVLDEAFQKYKARSRKGRNLAIALLLIDIKKNLLTKREEV